MAACPSTGLLQATKISPSSLEDLAMTAYLSNLQDACAVYIQERYDSVLPVLHILAQFALIKGYTTSIISIRSEALNTVQGNIHVMGHWKNFEFLAALEAAVKNSRSCPEQRHGCH